MEGTLLRDLKLCSAWRPAEREQRANFSELVSSMEGGIGRLLGKPRKGRIFLEGRAERVAFWKLAVP